MKNAVCSLAFDLGASGGRGIVGLFDGERLKTAEAHRFENNYVVKDGVFVWDVSMLLRELETALLKAEAQFGRIDSFGIDTWGVDFGLLDKNGRLLGDPRAYRYAEDAEMLKTWETIPRKALFERTGGGANNFDTIYQLVRRKTNGDAQLENADKLLMMPDLLGFLLTGCVQTEYTIATTTILYNPQKKGWDTELMDMLGLKKSLFASIVPSSSRLGRLRPELRAKLRHSDPYLCSVGCHDTASAVAAIPGQGDFAFCSSGTCSLFGMESEKPVINERALEAGFSNEGTIQGGFRVLNNLTGLWIIQECRRQWEAEGTRLSWNEIVEKAKLAPEFARLIDIDHPSFFKQGGMADKVAEYCEKTGQTPPKTVGETARCVYESMALKYRWALERLESITGKTAKTLNITGGGIKNRFLNQLAANATARRVVCGPAEGASMGNLLSQAIALGELGGITQLREAIARSIELETYEPAQTELWNEQYQRLLQLMSAANNIRGEQ